MEWATLQVKKGGNSLCLSMHLRVDCHLGIIFNPMPICPSEWRHVRFTEPVKCDPIMMKSPCHRLEDPGSRWSHKAVFWATQGVKKTFEGSGFSAEILSFFASMVVKWFSCWVPAHLQSHTRSHTHSPHNQNAFLSLYYSLEFYATRTQAPPTALILCSAVLLKNFALTMTGCLGRWPFPRTL